MRLPRAYRALAAFAAAGALLAPLAQGGEGPGEKVSAALRVERLPANDPETDAYPLTFELTGARRTGDAVELDLKLVLKDGFHIYGPKEEGYFPTTFALASGSPGRGLATTWPKPKARGPDKVYEGGAVFTLRVTLGDALPERPLVIEAGFGACTEEVCLAPQRWRLHVSLR